MLVQVYSLEMHWASDMFMMMINKLNKWWVQVWVVFCLYTVTRVVVVNHHAQQTFEVVAV